MKSLYSLFTFEIIDNIFKHKAEIEIKSMSKMLYINILMAQFKDKEANEKNAMAFEIFYDDIKNYKRWENNFKELHKARLLTIGDKFITVHNSWGTYIDRSQITDLKNAQYATSLIDAEHFKQNLVNNQTMFEVTGMKHRLSKENMLKMIDQFIAEQMVVKTKYLNESECTRHFIHWISKNSTNPMQSVIKSKSSKIIGKDGN
jgi:hypothetical protein